MDKKQRLKRKVLTLLTSIFVIISKRTTINGIKEVDLLDEPTTVYTYRSDNAFLAQVTPFDTIIWNENRIDQLSTRGKQLVLRHECSHRDRNSVFKGLFYGSCILFSGGLLLSLIALVALISGVPATELFLLATIAICLMCHFPILFRIDETLADYHALRELGENRFLDAYDEIASASDNSIRTRIFVRVFYTRPTDTVRIHKFIQDISKA